MTTPSSTKFKFADEMVSIKDIVVDESVQRPLEVRRVNRIVAAFNPAALGIFTVSRRNAVTLAIIDGQHRLEAFRRVNDNTGEVACRVFEGLTLEDEARMFIDLNTTAKPHLLDAFRVRVAAKDPVALEINNIVRPFGWDIANTRGNGYLQAIAAIEKMYRASVEMEAEPNLLDSTLRTITHAWGHDRDGVAAPILSGIGNLLAEHGSMVDLNRLERVLAEYPMGPIGLMTNARTHSAVNRMKVQNSVADLLTGRYNKGLTAKALPTWRKRS